MSSARERVRSLTPEQRVDLARELRARRARIEPQGEPAAPAALPDLGLFFFSADGTDAAPNKYELLLEAASLADARGLAAVWLPERHFHRFGGLYPNPALLAAALALRTRRIELRAGSVVLPLHHPVRVAEDWAVVDNLSGGRVSLSFASGWHPHDFVLAPGSYERRRDLLFESMELVKRLWAGESVAIEGVGGARVDVAILPRPLQPELRCWVTANSADTWARAGRSGADVLALVGQSIEKLAEQIATYRRARAEAGRPEPGRVAIMLHTFVSEDPIERTKALVRAPLLRYLRDFVLQLPQAPAAEGDRANLDTLLEFAFERYFGQASLLGPPEKCRRFLARLAAIGVDEAACLVDFGLPTADVLAGIETLARLRSPAPAQLAT